MRSNVRFFVWVGRVAQAKSVKKNLSIIECQRPAHSLSMAHNAESAEHERPAVRYGCRIAVIMVVCGIAIVGTAAVSCAHRNCAFLYLVMPIVGLVVGCVYTISIKRNGEAMGDCKNV